MSSVKAQTPRRKILHDANRAAALFPCAVSDLYSRVKALVDIDQDPQRRSEIKGLQAQVEGLQVQVEKLTVEVEGLKGQNQRLRAEVAQCDELMGY